jgi:molybdate/tungstate transport system ATP-binding protein
MLRCEGCRVRAGDFRLEINRLEVAAGDYCLVVGPSGAGKSLLLRTIAGLVRPVEGTVVLRGEDASAAPPEERRIGLVFQHYSLFPHLSVAENVAFGLRMRRVGKREARERANEMLDRLGCLHLADRRPSTLSGGEQQRVAIARALVTSADLLLLDEPFAALDPATRASCRAELTALRHALGLTVIEVTHALEEAACGADRILILERGRIVADGPYFELAARPPDLRTARALDLPNVVPAELAGGEHGAWCLLPAQAISIAAPDIAIPGGIVGIAGVVETIEPLGPIYRIRLRVGRPGETIMLTGFSTGADVPPAPGAPAVALIAADAVHPLLNEDPSAPVR